MSDSLALLHFLTSFPHLNFPNPIFGVLLPGVVSFSAASAAARSSLVGILGASANLIPGGFGGGAWT